MGDIDIIAKMADMKQVDYRNTLAISSLIELLIEKGIIERREVALKARELERMTIAEIRELRAKR